MPTCSCRTSPCRCQHASGSFQTASITASAVASAGCRHVDRTLSVEPPNLGPWPPRPRPSRPAPPTAAPSAGGRRGKWVGRCGECQAWGSVAELAAPTLRATAGPVTTPAVPIGQVSVEESRSRSCGVPELDRVLGGGLVPGAAILLAGEPGVGKSTLLLEVAAQTARLQPPHPLRHRRGVGQPGAAARRPHRRRTRRALPRRRDRPRRDPHPHRGGAARPCWSSTRSRPSAPRASTACRAGSPRSRRSRPR